MDQQLAADPVDRYLDPFCYRYCLGYKNKKLTQRRTYAQVNV